MGPLTDMIRALARSSQPNTAETLALRAALAPAAAATEAWRQWLAGNDLDTAGTRIFLILPTVYTNLSKAGYEGPEMGLLKGVCRQSWFRTQLLIELLGELSETLSAASIDFLVMGGLANASDGFDTVGARATFRSDLLVRHAELPRAVELLRTRHGAELEFTGQGCVGLKFDKSLRASVWSRPFASHPHLSATEGQWQRATRQSIGALSVPVMDPGDRLLQAAIGQVVQSEGESLIRHVDVAGLMRHRGEAIDWASLAEASERLGVTLWVAELLRQVRVVDPALLPREAAPLADTTGTLAQRAELWFVRRSEGNFPWGQLPRSWVAYHRGAADGGDPATWRGFKRHLATQWGDADLAFERHLARRLMGRLRSR